MPSRGSKQHSTGAGGWGYDRPSGLFSSIDQNVSNQVTLESSVSSDLHMFVHLFVQPVPG